MALTLLRHAAVHPKYQKRYNGWTDLSIEPSLFDAKMVAPLCKQHFDHIYSSDLMRCQETLSFMEMTPYTTDERLREVRFKAHIEGLSYQEVSRRSDFDASLLEDPIAWHNYICAERYEAFSRRIDAFLTDLPKDKEILVCTHGGVMQHMLALLHLPLQQIDYLNWIRIEHYEL